MESVAEVDLFTSLCTIMAPPATLTVGAPIGPYTPVPGLINIPCLKASPSPLRVQGTEVKSIEEQQSIQPWHVLLNDYYAALDGHTEYQAVIDGIDFDVLGVEHDSQMQMSRLSVREVTL